MMFWFGLMFMLCSYGVLVVCLVCWLLVLLVSGLVVMFCC